MAERPNNPTRGAVAAAVIFQLGIGTALLALTYRTLTDFGRSWHTPLGPAPSLYLTYLLAACSGLCMLAALGLVARQRWARWFVVLFVVAFAFLAGSPLKTLVAFLALGGWFAGIPFLLAVVLVAIEVNAFRLATHFPSGRKAA